MKQVWTKTKAGLLALFLLLGFTVLLANPQSAKADTLTGVTNLYQKSATTTQVVIDWDTNASAYKYILEYSADNGVTWTACTALSKSSSSKTLSGLVAGKSYYVRVKCVDKAYINGDADGQETEWSQIEAVTCPVKPDTVSQTGGSPTSVDVEWSAVDGATKYLVQYAEYGSSSRIGTFETTETSYQITDMNPSSKYRVYVYPVRVSAEGFEAQKSYKSAYVCTAAEAVQNPEVEKWVAKSNKVSLKWDKIAKNNSGYEICVMDLEGNEIDTKTSSRSSLTYTNKAVKNSGFIFKVRGYKTVNETIMYGEWSEEKLVLASPKLNVTKKSDTKMKLKWNAIEGAESYTIFRCTSVSGDYEEIKTTTSTSYIDKKVNKNTRYYYYVVANGVEVDGETYDSLTGKNKIEVAYRNGSSTYYKYIDNDNE